MFLGFSFFLFGADTLSSTLRRHVWKTTEKMEMNAHSQAWHKSNDGARKFSYAQRCSVVGFFLLFHFFFFSFRCPRWIQGQNLKRRTFVTHGRAVLQDLAMAVTTIIISSSLFFFLFNASVVATVEAGGCSVSRLSVHFNLWTGNYICGGGNSFDGGKFFGKII